MWIHVYLCNNVYVLCGCWSCCIVTRDSGKENNICRWSAPVCVHVEMFPGGRSYFPTNMSVRLPTWNDAFHLTLSPISAVKESGNLFVHVMDAVRAVRSSPSGCGLFKKKKKERKGLWKLKTNRTHKVYTNTHTHTHTHDTSLFPRRVSGGHLFRT